MSNPVSAALNRQVWAVDPYPGMPPRLHNGVLLISTEHPLGTHRADARERIRANICDAMALMLGLPSDAITFVSHAGHPPRLLIRGLPEPGLSISHEDRLSLAAVNLQGPVGVDLMQVQEVPNWQSVAQDYLGPDVTEHLRVTPDAERPRAFANAWCRQEARLKCHGLALAEWAAIPPLTCPTFELNLPYPMVGALALP
ncbi:MULTISPECIES: 4'-phosphopantetheinyl transferase family protein [unclassified Pseudomonas]|uniref:4'-phosphopantetheinyl transferase family protein n=1 Tax=unclassified Pseudomonas TaxID=196821 RepID=UPI002AC8ACA1|nr:MULTISPECIES: 4'-phosphopantetheinyl transferase superfamily protein [unclassified Pseudomonas]MEB0045633.1 4'-phosphopantetheinyl transferase superfamily protein [Pseudomonas sp. Dout3]MEB0095516.1 4'-phosphopantetheinyl transferase superfamily protein [Pseudomonas sp. DC1.2]WPX61098.1 4'-phosphopantetheinyl transferase superfamily protein [Pseudomonas sp. DC1.2]